MARIVTKTGLIQVGEAGLTAELSTTLSASTGTVTAQTQGKKQQAASTGPTALALGGVTSASFLYIKAIDATTGAAKNFTPVVNGVTLPDVSELTLLSQTNSITSVSLTTGAGNATEFEITVAGV